MGEFFGYPKNFGGGLELFFRFKGRVHMVGLTKIGSEGGFERGSCILFFLNLARLYSCIILTVLTVLS